MNFLNTYIKFFIVILIVGLCFYGWRFIPQTTKADHELIVGTASGYAPFVSLNEQGLYEGFDIDIAQEIAHRINKTLVIKDLGSMTSLLIALKQKKIDALIWGISMTPERMKEYALIHYQGDIIDKLPLVFWGKIPADIQTIYDLKKYPDSFIVVEPGSSNEAFLHQFEFIKLKSLEKIVDAVLDIKYGKSLATMIDPALVEMITKQYPQLKVLWIALPTEWRILGNGIGINKTNKELIEKISEIIKSMKEDGTIARLEAKWNMK